MDPQPTQEELAAEQAAAQVPKEEEIRADIIAEYGFDETEDVERIDKLVAKDLEQRSKLSKAIAAKIKHREAAAELTKKIPQKETTTVPSDKKEDELSTKDLYALMSANVPQDDVEEVVKAAKILNKSISEALKDLMVQTVLKTREEYRATANAANVAPVRPGSKKVSDEEVLAKASKGEIPEAGSKEAEALFWARRNKGKK